MTLSRVFLPEVGWLRPARIAGAQSLVRDGSALEWQLGELIAIGASEVAVKQLSLAPEYLESLPSVLRKRVVGVDKHNLARQKADAVCVPIMEELGLFADEHGVSRTNHSAFTETDRAAIKFLYGLETLILGIQERLCIDLDIVELRKTVEMLRAELNSSAARANLAVVAGLLLAYKETVVDCVDYIPTPNTDRLLIFNDFVEDVTYKLISSEFHNLGIPDRSARAATLISRFVRDLLKKPFVKKTAQISSRVIATASQIPVTDSDITDTFCGEGYLPPIVNIMPALADARRRWLESKPSIILDSRSLVAHEHVLPDE